MFLKWEPKLECFAAVVAKETMVVHRGELILVDVALFAAVWSSA
jgi:hypothetical protein